MSSPRPDPLSPLLAEARQMAGLANSPGGCWAGLGPGRMARAGVEWGGGLSLRLLYTTPEGLSRTEHWSCGPSGQWHCQVHERRLDGFERYSHPPVEPARLQELAESLAYARWRLEE